MVLNADTVPAVEVLDLAGLRIAFCLVCVGLLGLFSALTWRTRSSYSLWWCVALVGFLAGSALYLLDGTAAQWWSNPAGSCAIVAGGGSVWTAARSLHSFRPPLGRLCALVAVVGTAAALDSPATNTWAGGAVFLAAMTTMLALASRDLWLLEGSAPQARIPMAVASGLSALFYAGRTATFVVVGPHHDAFVRCFGSAVTTLMTIVLLLVVSFTITGLASEQAIAELHRQATRDGLTQLLNRAEFHARAAEHLRWMQRTDESGCLVLADLDHFKQVNDLFGHAAGDSALQVFAEACRGAVRATDLVGRLGGEEFAILFCGMTTEGATKVITRINAEVHRAAARHAYDMPTASYGIAPVRSSVELGSALASADAALYAAKEAGRNRIVVSA